MKLEFDAEILGDDADGDFILDHGGPNSRVVQQEALAGGSAPFTGARGNHSNQRSFTVSKQHASPAAAVEWFNTHPDELPDGGVLRITEGSFAAEMTTVLVSVDRVELSGVSTQLRYTFTGGQITVAA